MYVDKIGLFFMALFIVFSFVLHIGGLMHLIPLYLTSPILFFSLFILLIYLNNRKKFRGF
nr:hypothetical protein [Bacillus sp. ISL-35]